MKRIISALLTVAMLFTLITVPMMVTADAWSKPATYTHTNELLNTDLATLYAVKGTPTIDGVVDDAWADAYTLRVDYSTMQLNKPSKEKYGMCIDIYMMWDENNLYILEERPFDTVKYAAGKLDFWSGDNGNCYLLTLPTGFTNDSTKNDGAVCMTYVHVGNATTKGVPAQGYVTKQTKYYTANTGSTSTISYANESKAKTYTTLTDTGFLMETAISWDALDDYTPGFSAAADMILGLGMYYVPGGKDNGNHANYTDVSGHQAVKLLGEGVKNPTPMIHADFSWYDESKSVYEIWDASDLLGALHISHATAMEYANNFKNAVGYTNTNFAGKTLKIMADIDLNPGTVFNEDGTWSGVAPRFAWTCLQDFKGTIDGQGHTISGLYLPGGITSAGSDTEIRYVGLVGRGGAGLTIKDLSLTNGYLAGVSSSTNHSAASFLSVAHHYNGAGTITLENLYSDLHLRGTEFSGGIVGSTWYDNTLVWDVDNCVFTGTVKGGSAGTLMGRDSAHSAKNSGTIKNCYVPAGTTAIKSNSSSVVETGDAVYVQFTDAVDGKRSIRILCGVDNLNLKEIGFDVKVTRADGTTVSKTYTTSTVYNTIRAAGATISAKDATGYEYVYALVINDFPDNDPITLSVTPFRTMKSGGKAVSIVEYSNTYLRGEALPETATWVDYIPAYTSTSQTQSYSIDTASNIKEYGSATKALFDEYVGKLKSAGFAVQSETSLDQNCFALLKASYATVYVSYNDVNKTLRIYAEEAGHFNYPTDAPATSAGTTHTPKMWQLRVDNINSRENGGMSYVFLLADGTFFVIDGGYKTDAEADNLYNFLKSKNPNGGEPVISGWYFSHTHGDHIGAIQAFAPKYADKVDVKAFYYHFENSIPSGFKNATAYWTDAVHYGRLHTGMKINLPGLSFNVMYTLEDLYKTGFSFTNLNANNYSAVIRVDVTANSTTQKIMFLGDIQAIATKCIKSMYASNSEALKADFVQFSHHGYEGADKELYDKIAAPTVLWPINVVSTQNSYGSICNVFTKWGMGTASGSRTETDPVTGADVTYNFPNKAIWGGYTGLSSYKNASYVKKIVLAGESASQEFAFPYTPSGSKQPDVSAIYTSDLPLLVPDASLFPFS